MFSKELELWKTTGQYFNFNGHNIFYRNDGVGEVILFLHGFPTSSWDWNLIWPALRKSHNVIALDFLGFGFSDKPKNLHYTIEMQVDLLEELLKELDVSTLHIFAHDYGDTVAQEMLHRKSTIIDYPLDIESVFMLNGGIFPEAIKPLRIQKLLSGPFGSIISGITNEWIIRKRFTSIFADDKKPSEKEWKDFWAVINFNNGKNISYRLSDYMNQRIQHKEKWSKSLEKCDIPLKLVIGREDPISGIQIAETFENKVANADVELLAEIGHYPQVEDPDLILRIYKKFLRSL